MISNYESHVGILDKESPYVFHLDKLENNASYAHWHENLELLYIVSGGGHVITDNVSVAVRAGQVAVINSNHIHTMIPEPAMSYYCLIVDKVFLESFGFYVEETVFERLVDSAGASRIFRGIIREIEQKKKFYESQVKADIVSLLVCLSRDHTAFRPGISDSTAGRKLAAVKEVLRYLQKHYREPVALQDVADAVGFNKYYISHLFKEIVGCSMVHYINYLRCSCAKSLLSSEKYTVSEVAELCGFENLSYFSKTYKKHMSLLPREQKGHGAEENT